MHRGRQAALRPLVRLRGSPRAVPSLAQGVRRAALSSALDYHELHGQGTPLDEMYDSKEQCRQDTALMWVPPAHPPPHIFFAIDPGDERWVRGNDRLHEKLNALGVPHTLDMTTRAGGHSWDYFNHMAGRAMRFLFAGLEQESRRLL